MLSERLKWFGSVLVGGSLTTYLTWAAVADRLPHWTLYAVPAAAAVVAVATFPYGRAENGSPQRVITTLVRGRGNAALVSGDSSPMTGNIVSTGKGHQITVHQGTQLSIADIRQISVDASRAEVLPAARQVASEVAVAEIDRRVGTFTDKVVQRANQTDPALFVRWDDPRFLAALTSAQRSYAETGDDDLGDLLANLIIDMAGQPIRTRHEIVLRQAVDVAPRLTTDHVNALVTIMVITRMKLEGVYENTDGLINALDGLFRPYYGRLPSGEIDYLYMCSTGVCYHDQLHQFTGGVYQRLHEKYPNAMYPAFTYDELREDFISDTNPLRDENSKLLGVIAMNESVVIRAPDGQMTMRLDVAADSVRFRVEPNRVATILASRDDGVGALSESEKTLRHMVRERSLTVDQFQAKVADLKPDLAAFLDYVQRTGALHYVLHPVGFILAQHAIKEHAPPLADAVNAAFDTDS